MSHSNGYLLYEERRGVDQTEEYLQDHKRPCPWPLEGMSGHGSHWPAVQRSTYGFKIHFLVKSFGFKLKSVYVVHGTRQGQDSAGPNGLVASSGGQIIDI